MAIIGIDFGTTNSVMSINDEYGKQKTIPNSEGEDHTPTVVSFEDKETPIVGREAENQKLAQPDETYSEFKLKLGSSDVLFTTASGKQYAAKDFAALVLAKLKRDAEQHLGESVDGISLTVPANFTNSQDQDVLDAAESSGLKVLQLLHEPTSAAIAYSVDKGQDQLVMVADLGGGTFDVSLVRCTSGKLNVLGTDGIADLGGGKFTQDIVGHVLSQIDGVLPDPQAEPALYQDIHDRAESAKLSLAVKESTKITLSIGGTYKTVELTRDQFNALIEHRIQQLVEKCESLLQQCSLNWDSIDKVLLVGGGSKTPAVNQALETAYGRPVSQDIDGMKAIAFGAAIYAAVLAADADGNVLYQGRAIPTPKIEVQDVTAHGIGCTIDDPVRGETCAVIIKKHSPIPSEMEDRFRLKTPEQSSAAIEVLSGEDGALKSDCERIGEIVLDNLPPEASLPLRIRVRYVIDKNGICTAYAEDEISGKKKEIEIDYSNNVNRAAAS